MDASPRESADWVRTRELFLDLADLPREEQARRLESLEVEDAALARQVRRLLDEDPGEDDSAPATAEAGELFGHYRAVRRIAVGGMGEVLVARRSDGQFEREVAIKRLRPGAGSVQFVQRFLRERQTLARLEHEYIARLLDGGTSDRGEPYLVLEYVRGRHIDAYCREEGLDANARVELFVKVLEAVQYAHAHGVIHRDIKPSNLLVRDDGEPRLLDFGIARWTTADNDTTALTGTGQRLFTPEYASPEQVRGETVTEATDVFSLGVVLYGLLAEAGPWEETKTMFELERSILEREPAPPSQQLSDTRARRAVTGDLDTIVLHCLQKRPADRFPSVQALADELGRYLRGEPITTRPTGPLERLVRQGRRNPWRVLATGVLIVALVAVGSAWRSRRAADRRGEELLSTLQVSLDHARNLGVQDQKEAAVVELRTILEQLVEVEGQDLFHAQVLGELCMALQRVGEPEEALAVFEQGLALLPEDPTLEVELRARFLLAPASAYRALAEHGRASEAIAVALQYAEAHLEPGHPLRIEAYQAYGSDETIPLQMREERLRQGVEEARRRNKPNDGVLSSILTLHGVLLWQLGRCEEALPLLDESLEIDRWHHGDGHGDVGMVRNARALCLLDLGREAEALEEFEAILTTFEMMGHTDMGTGVLRRIGELRLAEGDYEGALEALNEARPRHFEALGDHRVCHLIDGWIAQSLAGLGRHEEAREAFESAFEGRQSVANEAPEFVADLRVAFAQSLLELNDIGAAWDELEQALALRTQALGPEHESTLEVRAALDEL